MERYWQKVQNRKGGHVPRSRFDELAALAEENDGLVTAGQARAEGFTDSVLARLVQRRRIERIARGVYRIPHFSPGEFSQYREAVLWAKANRGPDPVAISHATALAVYGISDASPASIHITVPRDARLRRKTPRGVVVHHGDLPTSDIAVQEGIPVTTIERTIADLLQSGGRTDLLKQAVSDACREGYITDTVAARLRRRVESHPKSRRSSTRQSWHKASEDGRVVGKEEPAPQLGPGVSWVGISR
jgi:predicted transcriptional regulator of viral defense system